jgi:hypothetical protein
MQLRAAILLMFGLATSTACSEGPKLTGKVVDIWGNPIAGATVLIDESKDRANTNPQGSFEFKKLDPGSLHLMAGAKGYVKDIVQVDIPADKKTAWPTPEFALWKDPPGRGFFAKGYKDLLPIPAARVVAIGSDIKEIHGVRDIPDTLIPSGTNPPSILFSSSIRPSEISQLDLKMARLRFVEDEEWVGVTGMEKVTLKVWVFEKDVPFQLRGLLDKNTFLITPKSPLEAGIYAFHSQDVLTGTSPGNLARYPEEMQVVNVFEIK